jgi:hypothetical protein
MIVPTLLLDLGIFLWAICFAVYSIPGAAGRLRDPRPAPEAA